MAVIPWLIAPGLVQPDTKADLTLAPWSYLARSLTAWNDHSGLGELQNQAYGYLFPMGPVMGVGQWLGLPEWAAQRAWWSLLLVLAWWGTDRLIRRLGVAGPAAAMVAATSYALAPRVLTVLSQISAEAWPAALAPWLMLLVLPLTQRDATTAQRWRAVAGTGLVVAALGGVNAVASAVVLMLPALMLVVARARPQVWLMWASGVVVGALWWVAPLLVLGKYAYPFLDYIETSNITTATTSATNSLRGASHWVAYILDGEDHPVWQSGWVEAQHPIAIVATAALAGVGLAGLMLMQRSATTAWVGRWASAAVVVGVLLMAVGHAGRLGSPVAEMVQGLLDGPLAPLRNVHKLDPVLRLPIALGLAHVVTRLAEQRVQMRTRVMAAGLAAAVVLSPLALWTGRAADAAGYPSVPTDWTQTATTVDQAAERSGGASLLLPASRNAHYEWGNLTDEPLTALAASPVVVRASAPLGHPGSTRILDYADQLAASGKPQPSLAAGLARMGLRRVVVRHDLTSSTGAHSSRAVEKTLTRSPGFTRLAQHGKVSVWSVTAPASDTVTGYPAKLLTVAGGPEATFDLLAAGLLSRGQGSRVGPGLEPADVVTDSAPWRVYHNGRPAQFAYGPALRREDSAPTQPGSRDLPPAGEASTQPTMVVPGMTSLRASTSAADPFARGYRSPRNGPASALDQDPSTAWISDHAEEGPVELMGETDSPVAGGMFEIQFAQGPGVTVPTSVEVTFAGPDRPKQRETYPVNNGSVGLGHKGGWTTVRIRLLGLSGDEQGGIREVTWPGSGRSYLQLPEPVDLSEQALMVRRDPYGADGPSLVRGFTNQQSLRPDADITVRPRPGRALNQLLDGDWTVSGPTSSSAAAQRPGAAVDGRSDTTWTVPAGEGAPTLRVKFATPQRIRGIALGSSSTVTGVRVRTSPSTPVTTLGPTGGRVDLRTRNLDIQLTRDDASGTWEVPEITLDGVDRASPDPEIRCGNAGFITVGQNRVSLRATPSMRELLEGAPIPAQLCVPLVAAAGDVVLEVGAGATALPERVVMGKRPTAAVGSRDLRVMRSASGERQVRVGAGSPMLLTLPEGENAGWQARTSDGSMLRPVTVDGWRQAFILETRDATTVDITFAPTRLHRAGLAAGAVGVLVLALLWLSVAGHRPAPWRPGAVRTWPRRAAVAAAAGAGAVIAGPVGLLIGLAVAMVPRVFLSRLAVGGVATAGVVLAVAGAADQQSVGAVLAQGLSVVSVAALVAGFDSAPTGSQAPPRTEPRA